MNTQPLEKTTRKFRQKSATPEIRRDILSRVVEAEIIPRLMMVHRCADPQALPPLKPPLHAEVEAFCELLLADDVVAINSYVDVFRKPGLSVETIFLGLMAKSARHLGELWDKDVCNFCEVTMAMWRLHQLLHELSPAFHGEVGAQRATGKRVLLSTIAAEQHTLGLSMVAEFFRRDGWDVVADIPASNDDLLDCVGTEWLDIVGLSISGDVTQIQVELAETITLIRQHSLNPRVGVMVGGWAFTENPELLAAVGADFTAPDARQAVAKADERVQRLYETTARTARAQR